jgi:hypothetical protein
MPSILRAFLAVPLISLLVSCGDIAVGPNSTSVGAACTADNQCQHQCLIDDRHFPGGMCTLPCATDANCPAGSFCIEQSSGICVAGCHVDADCTGFGRGFVCDRETRATGGDAMICRVP